MTQPKPMLVEARNLRMNFTVGKSWTGKVTKLLQAVQDVSFGVEQGTTFGLVGESGCGKTTVGRTLVRLYNPSSGSIVYNGRDITNLTGSALLEARRPMQMIFQDPYASLDPRMTVGSIISEPLRNRSDLSAKDRADRIHELIRLVGLKPDHALRYPHEFSGGQRQRIGIARALANDPKFIVCDEPISALDVSIQAQIINMLEDLQSRLGLTYLFVSHDLSMVRHISHTVGVMYLGCMVEMAPVAELYGNMLHPYTRALMSAAPIADPDLSAAQRRTILSGDVPTPINPPPGCCFQNRCPLLTDRCKRERPIWRDAGAGHFVACHRI